MSITSENQVTLSILNYLSKQSQCLIPNEPDNRVLVRTSKIYKQQTESKPLQDSGER